MASTGPSGHLPRQPVRTTRTGPAPGVARNSFSKYLTIREVLQRLPHDSGRRRRFVHTRMRAQVGESGMFFPGKRADGLLAAGATGPENRTRRPLAAPANEKFGIGRTI